MLNRGLYEGPVRDAIKRLMDDEALSHSPLAKTLLAAAYGKQWPGLSPGQIVRHALRDCWETWARRTAREVENDGAIDLEAISGRDRRRSDTVLARFNAMVYTGARYGLAPGQQPLEANGYSAWVANETAVVRLLEQVFDCGTHPWDRQDLREAAQVLRELYNLDSPSTASGWLGYAVNEMISVWNEREEILKEACAQLYYTARGQAEQVRRGWLTLLRWVLFAGAGLIFASLVYQGLAIGAWLDQPEVVQMMAAIGHVVEGYPQPAMIVDAFAWGELTRRTRGIVAGFVLLALVVPGAEVWVENVYKRTLAPLREWELNPEAYIRRAIQEDRIILPPELFGNAG